MRRWSKGCWSTGLATAVVLVMHGAVHAGGWSTTSRQVECVDPTDCAPADDVYRSLLEHSSG